MLSLQARQKAEAAAAAAQQQLERESSRDHAAFEAEQDSTDQGGDEGMIDAEGSPTKQDQEQVGKLQKALQDAQASSLASEVTLTHYLVSRMLLCW